MPSDPMPSDPMPADPMPADPQAPSVSAKAPSANSSQPAKSQPTKSQAGRFFEDFSPGQILHHPTPRTIRDGDVALNIALTGSRAALFSSSLFAQNCGLPANIVDPLLIFHMVFGKSVPDISINAIANLGYAEGRVLAPVEIGDTIYARSEVLGAKQNQSGENGVVYVRTTGYNQRDQPVLSYVRWVMVRNREAGSPGATMFTPNFAKAVPTSDLIVPAGLDFAHYDGALAGCDHYYDDYAIGERIDHCDGMTLEESEHQLATRLYQNTARVHFDALAQKASRFARRLVYGGVALSLARALSDNGLANASWLLAINGGRHVNPLFAGDTVYAWSEVLDKAQLSQHVGALRLRLVALANCPATDFPDKSEAGQYPAEVILDFDYWAAIPIR